MFNRSTLGLLISAAAPVMYSQSAAGKHTDDPSPSAPQPSLLCRQDNKPASGRIFDNEVDWSGYGQVDYTRADWTENVAHSFGDLERFMERKDVAFAAIDIRHVGGEPRFHYLSNGQHNRIVQPWSSTKWLAGLVALKTVKELGVSANGMVSGSLFGSNYVRLGDLFTKVHSYRRPAWLTPTSNEISTWFKTVAGRAETHDLVINRWLRRSGRDEQFGGGYNSGVYPVGKYRFLNQDNGAEVSLQAQNDAPNVNNQNLLSMLTLAEAFKRVITHEAQDSSIRFPRLSAADFDVLFWGDREGEQPGGMAVGDTRYTLGTILDELMPDELQRDRIILGKTGSGCNSVRGCEQVLLSYVCLPEFNGGREIVTAVFTQKPTADAARTVLRSTLRGFFQNYLR